MTHGTPLMRLVRTAILNRMEQKNSDIALVYVTFADQESALKLARACVENKLAACANVFQPHTAIYRWNAKVETASETAVLFKTTATAVEKLRRYIGDHHSYDVPCIATIGPSHVAESFSEWIRNSVG